MQSAILKTHLAAVFILLLSGCYSLKHIEVPPEDIRHYVLVEKRIPLGTKLVIVDKKGERHHATYHGATNSAILGNVAFVGIKHYKFDDILVLESKERDDEKTLKNIGRYLIGGIGNIEN